ncbi:MAG: hypothetical protein U5P41_06590 [Gammaproteobacteria bacterium]|nr:hypothetical protein [Gammaproteobacteria bacterium]
MQTARPSRYRDPGGYLYAVAGSLAGAFVLGALGLLCAMLYIRLWMPHAELGAIIPVLIGLYAGILLGVAGGCGLLLRLKGYQGAWQTAVTSTAMTLLCLPLFVLANSYIYLVFETAGPAVSAPLLVILLTATVLLARRLTGRMDTKN